jgi:type I restriction enzyme S subunit
MLSAPDAPRENSPAWLGHAVSSKALSKEMRFEGFFYNPEALRMDQWAERHRNGHWLLGDIADVFDVPPFKHIYVEAEHGIPFYTSGDLFGLDRVPEKYLSRTRTRGLEKYILKRGWVLLARSGQLGGILGRPQFADSALTGASTSDHVIRLVARESEVPAGYLYAYLAAETIGYVPLTRAMTGASIPALWPVYLKRMRVVKAERTFMLDVHERVVDAFEKRVRATAQEATARRLVERAIEDAG